LECSYEIGLLQVDDAPALNFFVLEEDLFVRHLEMEHVAVR
jgi:hypothetical protein